MKCQLTFLKSSFDNGDGPTVRSRNWIRTIMASRSLMPSAVSRSGKLFGLGIETVLAYEKVCR